MIDALAIPTVMLGDAPEPRSRLEHGEHLIAYAEAAGIDPLDLRNADADYAVLLRLRRSWT